MALRLLLLALLAAVALGEELNVVSPESFATAATLLGAICFQMSLFYLTNHSDADMRRYTYEVISATISIFCAVLLFQSVNGLLEATLFEGLTHDEELLIDGAHMLFWYVALQITLAVTSGALNEYTGQPNPDEEVVEANMKCFAVLLAHITGFASINFWSGVQQTEVFKSTALMSFLTLPISALGQLCLQKLSKHARRRIALGDDGEIDQYERMWDEETIESENDVMGLTLSFQTVQAIRFAIGGALPKQEGGEEWAVLTGHSGNQARLLLFVGLVFAALVFGLLMSLQDSMSKKTRRFLALTITTLSMAFAWSTFFAYDWYLGSFKFVGEEDAMVLALTLANLLSVLAFLAIRILDKLADNTEDAKFNDSVKQIITAIGILVGFSWEQTFDLATECLASRTNHGPLVKLGLAVFCAVILVPAWRWWILPMVISEGWKCGFVIDSKNESWMINLLGHRRFDHGLERLKQIHEEEDQALHCESKILKVSAVSSFIQKSRTSSAVQDSNGYAELAGGEDEELSQRAAEVAELRQRNAHLEAALQKVLGAYHSHMDAIHGSLGRIHDSVSASNSLRSTPRLATPGLV